MTFEDRMKAAGLTVKPEDQPKLAALVKDLDRTAALVNTPRATLLRRRAIERVQADADPAMTDPIQPDRSR
jgi:hypothetical protein